jgi:hypothetical protein
MACVKALDGIGGHWYLRRDVGKEPATGSPEPELAVGEPLDVISLLVHRAVMPATEGRIVRGVSPMRHAS